MDDEKVGAIDKVSGTLVLFCFPRLRIVAAASRTQGGSEVKLEVHNDIVSKNLLRWVSVS